MFGFGLVRQRQGQAVCAVCRNAIRTPEHLNSNPKQTASAASSVQPPAKTERRRSSARFRRRQAVVAPVDQRPQRLVPRQRAARAAGEQPEAVVQARRDLRQR